MIKGVIHAYLGPIWYHSEPSDVPNFPNQFLGWDFFCHFLQRDSSKSSLLGFATLLNLLGQSPVCFCPTKLIFWTYHLKLSFQLNPPQVISEAVTYSNVSSEMTSIIGHTTALRFLAISASKGSNQPSVHSQ